MNRFFMTLGALSVLATPGCAPPFEYDKATREDQIAYLDDLSQGLFDGLKSTLPHGGASKIYAEMGKREFDPELRQIKVTVEIQSGEEYISSSNSDKEKVMKRSCEIYMDSELETQGITVLIRYALPGGGTALSLRTNKERCDEFKQQQG